MRDLGEWDAHLGKHHLENPKKCQFPHTQALIHYLGQSKETAQLLTPPKRTEFLDLVGLPYELGVMLHADPRLRAAVMDEILQRMGYDRLPQIMDAITAQMMSMDEPLGGKVRVLELLFSQTGILRPRKQILEMDKTVNINFNVGETSLPIARDEEVIEGYYEEAQPPALEEPPEELQFASKKPVTKIESVLQSVQSKRTGGSPANDELV